MAWYNPSDPTQRNWMLGGIVALVLIVPFNMYLLTPKIDENDVVRDRLETLDIQNRQARLIVSRGQDGLEERMALYERHVQRLEELIPATEEIAVLLDQIQEIARTAQIDVQGLDPEPIEVVGPYNTRGFQMTVVGEYHDVGRFLTEVASLPRIVTPAQVDIQIFGQPASRPSMENPVQASFRIETYVLPDPTTLPPAELPGG